MSNRVDGWNGTPIVSPQSNVSRQQQSAVRGGEGEVDAGSRNWPRFFLLLSCISMGLAIATSILNLITLNFGVSSFFLDAYLVVLCFFALSAELRQVNCLRKLIYTWIKYVYFLTTYIGRSFFYIFLGSLVFGSGILRCAAALVAIFLGILMFVVSICANLPTYIDPEMVQEEEEAVAARRAATGGANSRPFVEEWMPSSSASPYTGKHFTSVAADTTGTSADPPRNSEGGYRPPGINEGPNAL